MERGKQIEQASVEYQMSTNPRAIGGAAFEDLIYRANINPDFINGANWADEHPRKGLVDIEKVCKWMNESLVIEDSKKWYVNNKITLKERMIEDFRKAMEE